jgi:hypothetical protein
MSAKPPFIGQERFDTCMLARSGLDREFAVHAVISIPDAERLKRLLAI